MGPRMRAIVTLPVILPLAILANRVRAAADRLERRNRHPRLHDRLESLHQGLMYVLIWMEGT